MYLHVTENETNMDFGIGKGPDPYTLMYWTSLSERHEPDAIVSLQIDDPRLIVKDDLGYIFIGVSLSVNRIVTRNVYLFGTDFVLRISGEMQHSESWRLGLTGKGIGGALEYLILSHIQRKLPNTGEDFFVSRQIAGCESELRKKQLVRCGIQDDELLATYLNKLHRDKRTENALQLRVTS